MAARILNGTAMAAEIRAELVPRIALVRARRGRPPGLGILLVGDDAPSEIYVRNKLRAAAEVGIRADLERLPASAALSEVLAIVRRLNQSAAHDGVLVQAPLPKAMGPNAEQRVFEAIDPEKDVDGFSPVNVGRLVQKHPGFIPATPQGVIELLVRSGIDIAGARAVVIGRSDSVGKPTALLLLHRDATVVMCHSKTRDLAALAATADILVAAIGRPALVRREFVRPGATVIDVGITRLTDVVAVHELFGPGDRRRADFERRGAVVVGDVHPEVAALAGAISPVPGGVGPLTVAMLLSNTLRAAERIQKQP
jgi:methylenetetrahydrofolate dehydrogenase (NADP+) / methenyltetrahydrofolate cyclohydrolase